MAGINIPQLYASSSWSMTTITYSFLIEWPMYTNAGFQAQRGPLVQFNEEEKRAALAFLTQVSTFTNLNFVEVIQDNSKGGLSGRNAT
jgi:hypothetical protein